MTGLTVNSFEIAKARISAVTLSPLTGAFELALFVEVTLNPLTDDAHWIIINSASLTAQSRGKRCDVGRLFPECPFELYQPPKFPSTETGVFRQTLLPQQLAALEELRGGDDLELAVVLHGTNGTHRHGSNHRNQCYELPMKMPYSSWVAQLNSARAYDIFLVEFSIPLTGSGTLPEVVARHIRTAQQHLVAGLCRESIGECRQALEELRLPTLQASIQKLGGDWKEMGKGDRTDFIAAALHHLTHLASHAEVRGGELVFAAADAKLALSLTAALCTHRFGRA